YYCFCLCHRRVDNETPAKGSVVVWLAAMGRFLALAATWALFKGGFGADIVCDRGNGMCDGLIEVLSPEERSKSDLGCAATDEVPFCWWAIETGTLRWELYRNGMSQLIERNIRPFCEKVDEFYGFSFTNKAITLHNSQRTSSSQGNSVRKYLLVDVFYFCCARKDNCVAFAGNASDREIVNNLANKMLPYIVMSSDFSGKRTGSCLGDDGANAVALPGVDVCIFVTDSTTKMKIYNGPMMFNRFDVLSQAARGHNHSLAMLALEGRLCLSAKPADNNYTTHLKDGECLRYSSADGYFLYCCCYVRRELCAYAIDEYALENNSKHARHIWSRSAQLKRTQDVSLKSGESVSGRLRTYRDFIFSKPANRRKGRTASENNISLWHCAEGEIVLKKNGKGHHSNDLEK
uniref:Uncharacterized protein n=5 Tax=Parascaris univalens TaxID=6257 RepID=A0A914ZNH1_PARUN